MVFTGCSTRFVKKHNYYSNKSNNYNSSESNSDLYYRIASKYNINYKTLHAICFTESSEEPFVIHVNGGYYSGSHRFSSASQSLNYINRYLGDSNFDIGFCQINNWWINRLNISHSQLLTKSFNIDLAASIYRDNLKRCNNDVNCALSLYNTGKKWSSIGKKYSKRVLLNRSKLY